MTNHEFGSTLYRTTDEMLAAIAESWWTANGQNDADSITAMGCSPDGSAEARECIAGWGLDQPGEDGEPAHMARNEYTEADLAQAMRAWWNARPDLREEV
jgi:hypothetical protein